MNLIRNEEFEPNKSSPRIRLKRQMRARRIRGEKGGQLMELPPSLILLLIVIFFPMLDLLYYGFAFCGAWYLHNLEARAVSVSQPPPGQPTGVAFLVTDQFPELTYRENQFINGYLGQLLGLQDRLCQVTQYPDANNPAVVGSSLLNSIFHVKALIALPIPYFANIPALNSVNGAGIDFGYSTTVVQEEKGLN